MPTTPLDLCHKLIALATNNPNEEEAKLAALKAVRLIKEHNLLPGAPPVARRPVQPTPQQQPMSEQQYWYRRATQAPPPQPNPNPSSSFDDMYEDVPDYIYRSVKEQAAARERQEQAARDAHRRKQHYGGWDPEYFTGGQRGGRANNKKHPMRDNPTYADNKGHDWSLGNTCKQCQMPRDLFDRTGMTCHGYADTKHQPGSHDWSTVNRCSKCGLTYRAFLQSGITCNV